MKINYLIFVLFILGIIFIIGCAPKEIVEEPQQEIAAPVIKEETEVAEEAAQKIPIEQPKTPEPDRSPGSEYALSNLKKGLRERGVTDCRETYPQLSTDNTFVIDPSDSNILYIGVSYYGMFKSTDGGATWKAINNGILFYPNDKDLSMKCYSVPGKVVIDKTNPKRLLMSPTDSTGGYIDMPYAETAGIWETLDGGESWHQILRGEIGASGRGGLAIDPNNPQTIYFGNDYDNSTWYSEGDPSVRFAKVGILSKTTNGGQTWEELKTGLLEGIQAMRVFVDPSNSNNLWLFTQSHRHDYGGELKLDIAVEEQLGPMKSNDAGKTWTSLAEKLPPKRRIIFDGDVSLNNFNHVLIGTSWFGPDVPQDFTQKSYYTIDGGETFYETDTYIITGRYDPHDSTGNHLLGVGYSPNVMESNDEGATWHVKSPLPPEAGVIIGFITNFVWDPLDSNTVYMTGHKGNVWRSTDSGKNWENILNLDKLPK